MPGRQPIRTPSPPRPELEKLVAEALERGMTEEEYRQQKISWVYGNLPYDSDVTREDVEKSLASFRLVRRK